ncbi:MAG: hypothetical protein COA94_00985 [Rickettsiales bacterium]|nr:MAG: hypothetical protein COA94_00985 [Rickettsiales bacterium]
MGSFASMALPIAGGFGGFMVGGVGTAIMGANLGSAIGGMFASGKSRTVRLPSQNGARLGDLRVQISSYGEVIPKLYGTMRLAGNVIWSTDLKETEHVHTQSFEQSSGGKGGGGRRTVTTTQNSYSYTYSVTLAIAICGGEVDEISRIWADSKLISAETLQTNQGKFNIYLGTEDQLPDDIIARHKNGAEFPAYRGLCYVVIEDFPLEKYGNRIPNFSFEVRRTVRFVPAVEDKVRELILIPGSGEFVYADQVCAKKRQFPYGGTYGHSVINMHNYDGKPDMLLALDQMQNTLPNLEWVALVVTWFATSTNAGNCRIVPKVEFKDEEAIIEPQEWGVAGFTRETAEEVLRFDERTPTYGGTPSDHTITAICKELKSRGLNVMLYPMIFVDELEPHPKPWRGRIRANSAIEIDHWFNGGSGYNRFIKHYADLTCGIVNAFVIGSEMIGLTGFTDRPGSYPATAQFIKSAEMIKDRVSNNTIVTYAADWSEYHHTEGGWFNMDSLWASKAIDVVAIDAYFPLTKDLPQSEITEELIQAGWESGEGWDYYCDEDRTRHPFHGAKYAWKNLEHWWSTKHTNPDGNITEWQPRMKPVWFTEFGFPSVDACSNQPNVFYDSSSIESCFPRGSLGRVDFLAQRQALNASLDYLESRTKRNGLDQLVPKRFVWTWDARPFPAWPDNKRAWQDGDLWKTGHWVNGKFGQSSLAAIVADLLCEVGLSAADYDTSRLIDQVDGYIISQHITAREAIEHLQAAYFFDVALSDGILKFVPRIGRTNVAEITESELVSNNNQDINETIEITIAQELELPEKINITHIDKGREYDTATTSSKRQTVSSKEQVNIILPISMNQQQAKQIADITLYNAWQERKNYQLTLPPKYGYLEPTDIITVQTGNITHQMRIVKTDMQRTAQMRIVATNYNANMYDFHSSIQGEYEYQEYDFPLPVAKTKIELIDTPPLPSDQTTATVRIAVIPEHENWNGVAIYKTTNDGYDYKLLTTTNIASITGVSLNKLPPAASTIFDYRSEIIVQLPYGELNSVIELVLLNGANAALIGNELIQFQHAELIADHQYKLTKLLRGRQGTEHAIDTHSEGERFILLNEGILEGKVSHDMIGRSVLYKPVSIGSTLAETESVEFTHYAIHLKPFAPVHVTAEHVENNIIKLSWIRRARTNHQWRDNVDIPLGEEYEKYEIDIKTSDGKLITTIESTEPAALYDRDQSQDNLTATIYQISSIVGRGYGTRIEV